MKVLLVNPPGGYRCSESIEEPLGLAYIAAVLEENDIDVNILDMKVTNMNLNDYRKMLVKTEPEIVGITSMTINAPDAIEIAKATKQENKDITTVIGGVHATFMYDDILMKYPEVDIVVRFEGEYTMLDLIKCLESDGDLKSIQGIAYSDVKGKLVVTPTRPKIENLDELPMPARHLLPMELYKTYVDKANRGFTLITSRGCPFHCIFCSTSIFHGPKVRMHSVKRVVDEMEYLVQNYNTRHVSFADDLFTLNRRRVMEICNEILERGLDVRWGCLSRVDTVDLELLTMMKKAGCDSIFFGVESVSQKVLDKIRKGFTVEQAKKALKFAKQAGMRVVASFIVGLPGETLESALQILPFLTETRPDLVGIHALSPFPGTEIYEHPERYGIKILHREWNKYDLISPTTETEYLSAKDLVYLQLKLLKDYVMSLGMQLEEVKC